jgi:tetratricopeptide (TPR) repeat protein
MATAAARRHTDYYLGFIERQEGGESVAARAAIQRELPNVHAVWERAAQQQEYAVLERIVPTLHNFYNAQSWFQEGVDLFQFALAQMGTAVPAQTACDLWARKARLHIHIGQLQEAEAALAQATTCLGEVDDPERRSTVLNYLSMTNFYAGRYDEAIALLREALPLTLQADDMDGIAFTYNFLGSCLKAKGEYGQAQGSFEQALDAYQLLEDEIGAGIVLHNLGNLAQAMGAFAEALAYYRQCTALFRANEYTQGVATAAANGGRLALKMGE